MDENRPWLTFLSHAVLMFIVIKLTVVQFSYVEKKVNYS